jgi:hypothetical protein
MLLIVETITWKPHIETAMEIALRRRDDGEAVVYCNLREGLPLCEDSSAIHHVLDLPETRIRRACIVLEREGIEFERARYSPTERRIAASAARNLLRSCTTIDDLKQLRHGAFFDIGWGVLSSAVTVTRNSLVSLGTHRRMLQDFLESSILVYEKTRALIARLQPSEVLAFNGRFATTRPVLRAAESCGVPWSVHERGGDKTRFAVYDCLPHDLDRMQQVMREAWSEAHAADGHAFFQARRNRVERDWHSFTHGQVHGSLPGAMDGAGEWVTFFTSSEDEMFAIGDKFANQRFPAQLDAIAATANAARSIPGMRLCIRVHPHIAKKARGDRRTWATLELPGVLVIGPEDKTDSYALIERSKVVCTYGSTIGIEATYWGRPSLLFSRSYYDQFGVCEIAGSAEHIRAFLEDPKVFPSNATLPYGAFWERLGQPYRYYQAESLHRGRICGYDLDGSAPMRIARWLRSVTDFTRWKNAA